MRKTLLATAAVAAVSLAVGFGGIAAAQSQMGNQSGKGTSGAAPGATQKGPSPSGAAPGGKTMGPSGGQPAQSTERNGKENERLGETPSEQQKGMTRGAQEQKSRHERDRAEFSYVRIGSPVVVRQSAANEQSRDQGRSRSDFGNGPGQKGHGQGPS